MSEQFSRRDLIMANGFPCFKYNFVKILLLMILISISVSLKTLNILEYKSERRG